MELCVFGGLWHRVSLLIFILAGSSVLSECSDQGAIQPPGYSVSELRAAPDTIVVDGRQLVLETYLWRDFMPISPPDGKPLVVKIYVTTVDSSPLPSSVSVDALWVVHADQVWTSWLQDDPSEPRTGGIAKMARQGPKWGPDVYVDVIVRVFNAAHNAYLLRASHQYIGRTD